MKGSSDLKLRFIFMMTGRDFIMIGRGFIMNGWDFYDDILRF